MIYIWKNVYKKIVFSGGAFYQQYTLFYTTTDHLII